MHGSPKTRHVLPCSTDFANGAQLVSNVFRRLLATMPLRLLLVILLGQLLPLLQSTAVLGVPLLHSRKGDSGRPAAATLQHTMAQITGDQNWVTCHARSADTCGLREFTSSLSRPSL